jgi:O-methyltransferase
MPSLRSFAVAIRDSAQQALLRVLSKPAVTRGAQTVVRTLGDRVNYHVVRGMADPAQRPEVAKFFESAPWMITSDYVRHSTLALVCQEVREREVPGALGEIGVFRGDFAWLMSTYLPGREVHLFDTFSGFDDRDVAVDAGQDLVPEFLDFSDTDPESVRARFAEPELVKLHIGWFPESAEGIGDVSFACASIDADLYEPVLAGLHWFWDRLSPGGYILVHDFNNGQFGGAKHAVRAFQDSTGASVLPLPDWGGTAVVSRPQA